MHLSTKKILLPRFKASEKTLYAIRHAQTTPQIPTLKMHHGKEIPIFGMGTWQATDKAQLWQALEVALAAGYRYFDTAQSYMNEHILGEFFEEKIKKGVIEREDIFITTKLAPINHEPKRAERSIDDSLKRLRMNYIDLFLIHGPYPMKPNLSLQDYDKDLESFRAGKLAPEIIEHHKTWKTLEKYHEYGLLKSIGLSNFNYRQLKEMYHKVDVKPHNLQVELHIFHPQYKLINYCHDFGFQKTKALTVTSYATLGSPSRKTNLSSGLIPMEYKLVEKLAAWYKKTPAQILLRHMIQRGISVIPKSVTPERIKENIDIFDFKIEFRHMQQFEEIKEREFFFDMPNVKHHPWYPYLRNTTYEPDEPIKVSKHTMAKVAKKKEEKAEKDAKREHFLKMKKQFDLSQQGSKKPMSYKDFKAEKAKKLKKSEEFKKDKYDKE